MKILSLATMALCVVFVVCSEDAETTRDLKWYDDKKASKGGGKGGKGYWHESESSGKGKGYWYKDSVSSGKGKVRKRSLQSRLNVDGQCCCAHLHVYFHSADF